jgi:hypothetical protein
MKRLIVITALAVSTASAQSIKPRPLGAVKATSKELLGNPSLARALPNGSVIVNDIGRRRLLMLDQTLESYTVIADSTSGATNGYGQRPGALIPYVADSTLYLDATAGSFLVIDPSGKVTRVMSPPRPNDINFIASPFYGYPGFDAKGRMIYRSNIRPPLQQLRDGTLQAPPPADSQPLLRVDLDTRRADTIAYIRTPKSVSSPITLPNGMTMNMTRQVPLATIDDWAVLADGSVAVVRGENYRVDFIKSDGNKAKSDKISFDWKRLSDDDKLAIVDSIQKASAAGSQQIGGGGPVTMFGGGGGDRIMIGGGGRGDAMATTERIMVGGMAAAAVSAAAPAPAPSSAPASSSSTTAKTPSAGADAKSTGSASNAGGDKAAGVAAGGPAQTFTMPALPAPAIADIPDYMPPFTQTSARPDADGNLWIRTTTAGAEQGNVVYDIINGQGVLADRVDVPKGMSIIGFGKGGVVYLSQREGYGFRVLKAAVR